MTLAPEVDHIISRAECKRIGRNPNTMDNAESICHACHLLKSAQEQGRAAPRVKQQIGPDGYPTGE